MEKENRILLGKILRGGVNQYFKTYLTFSFYYLRRIVILNPYCHRYCTPCFKYIYIYGDMLHSENKGGYFTIFKLQFLEHYVK